MPNRWQAWGDVFQHYVNRGHDHADAATRADEWERRRARTALAASKKGSGNG